MCYSMYAFKIMISIYFVLLFALFANANVNKVPSIVRIYSNLAEIIQPLHKLPLEFSDEDWHHIRPDSITLIGEHVNITLQTITEIKNVLNNTEIYIRSPIASNKTGIKLIKATLVDQIHNLVKIQDDSIVERQTLYFTVPSDQIYHLQEPIKSRHYVNFKYIADPNSKVFVSYLQSYVHWRTQYQLNLHNDENDLIVTANIRNDGKSPIVIDQGELIGGDINLQTPHQHEGSFRRSRFSSESAPLGAMQMALQDSDSAADEPTVEQGSELTGLYVFPITKPFTINSTTNYLLPMFHPEVSVDRYGLISKSFLPVSNSGKAQRSYRLKSNRYLSQGQ
jgi:hypothetical protein